MRTHARSATATDRTFADTVASLKRMAREVESAEVEIVADDDIARARQRLSKTIQAVTPTSYGGQSPEATPQESACVPPSSPSASSPPSPPASTSRSR